MKPGRFFWQGNVACVEAALAAGCRFFAGYPITPQSEIMERMAKRMPRVGGIFIQMEDEIASIAACIGASWTGVKAMTATSGPGFSLMQENIGLAVMTETPCVIVDVQRAGPSTGQVMGAQGDIMQAKWGTHGDHEVIVLAPNSVQETFDLTIKAFNLSEEYRVPVILLTDECIAHMRETIHVPEKIEIVNRRKPKKIGEPVFGGVGKAGVPPMPRVGDGYNVLVTGSTHNEYGVRKTMDPMVHRKLVSRLVDKIRRNSEGIVDAETYRINECEVGVVSIGCTSRSVYDAVELAEGEGVKIGFVRPRVLWPFPEGKVSELAENVDIIVVPELNLGQLMFEVERVVAGRCKVVPLNKIGGGELITPMEIVNKILEAKKT